MQTAHLNVKHYTGLQDYQSTYNDMQTLTAHRQHTDDELWLLSHPPVYTQGLAGKAEHIIDTLAHPLIPIDRGGQITYHDPGQLIGYVLCDLKQRQFSIIDLINAIEQSLLDTLHDYHIPAHTSTQHGRGIYVQNAKIASIGLKIKRYCSYHGFALNIQSDLNGFNAIHPCGLKNIIMTNTISHQPSVSRRDLTRTLIKHVRKHFGYDTLTVTQL